MYFKWKTANNSPLTVVRERRMLKPVLKFFGAQRPVSSIKVGGIRQYQEKRRSQVSLTMKTQISARTVNYETRLLRGVVIYADCWTDQLEARYKPLRQVKSRLGKTADKEQLAKIMATAKNNAKPQDSVAAIDWGIGLAPGTRLRARLESAASTAVRTPVVAVIDYNYEQNGEIVVPAGAKAFGHLETADRSGYIGIRFDSLMMPGGSSVSLEAAATDLQLRPLRGKVEGKHTGKNILVCSFAGVGEIAATLVGRSSLNQPLSEGDLLRERVSNNIGQASDQTVANLALTEHVVVSVPADTEIYVILQKPVKESIQPPHVQSPPAPSQPSIEELRQLIQLQRELNQTASTKPE